VGRETINDPEYIMGAELLVLLFFWGAIVMLAAWPALLFVNPHEARIAAPALTILELRSACRERTHRSL